MKEFEVLNGFLKKCNAIYIYGCGKYGRILYSYLHECFKEVICGFIVSKKAAVDMMYCGQNVFEIDEIFVEDGAGVIVAMQQIPFEVKQNCYAHFSDNILFLYPDLIDELNKWMWKYYCKCYKKYDSEYELSVSVMNPDPSCIYKLKNNRQLFRNYDLQTEEELYEISNLCTIKAFENQYGDMRFLYDLPIVSKEKESVNIGLYVMTSHLDSMIPQKDLLESYEIALQVGAELTSIRKECLLDCEGEHISNKNREYCECTGLYWIWKNDSRNDYVGLEHYRRRMSFTENIQEIITCNDVDIILPIPQFCICRTYDYIVKSLVTVEDWRVIRKIIHEVDDDYDLVVDKYENGHFYFSCNIGLMKRSILDDYCEFAFGVADRLEKYYDNHNIIRKADRYMGFIFEHLFSIYIMKNYEKYKIYCTELLWCA